jgi:hypothetical protein
MVDDVENEMEVEARDLEQIKRRITEIQNSQETLGLSTMFSQEGPSTEEKPVVDGTIEEIPEGGSDHNDSLGSLSGGNE